jgi:eukaryotic-like serine/threonine-protein kinase
VDLAQRYKLLDTIGAGSFATVYRAQDLELGREVAIKQIHPQFLADSAQTERYWREASLLASFQHPHIVTIYDVARERGWLILELMQANLRDRLQGKAMDLKALQTTLTQALRALSALHARGILHGDVKPTNLMIDHRKRIKVGDFGLARRVSHDEGSVIRGTAKYMAPETLSQDFGEVGPQSDLYSLGFTAYEFLCGSKFETLFPGLEAFGRDRQAAWMMWHAAPDRKLPAIAKAMENVPPQLAKVIDRLVEKDPKKRYASADQALADLGATASDEPSGTEAPARPVEPKPPVNARRWIAVGAFALSMAVSGMMLFWTSPQTTELPGENPQKPVLGIVRAVDLAASSIEFIDPATGQPDELKLPEKPRIRMIADNGTDEFVLPKRLEPGDWIRLTVADGRWQLDATRPVTNEGRIGSVDTAANRVTVSIEQRRIRDAVDMHVPPRAKLELNGKAAKLGDLKPEDNVTVEHVLDPAGREGRVVGRLQATREVQISGTVIDFDPEQNEIAVLPSDGGAQIQKIKLAADCPVTYDDGTPAEPGELVQGRQINITADALVRKIILPK